MNTVIFENYESFITENEDSLSSPSDIVRLLTDEGMYRTYVDSLTEGLDAMTRTSVTGVLDRQREVLIQESANVPAATFASGWTVMSFPILADIYAEPIIAQLCNVYPVDKPVASIPRVKIKSTVTSFDGTSEISAYIPDSTKLIRAGEVTVNVAANTNTNIFTAAGLPSSDFKMNRRYSLMNSIQVTETDASSTETIHAIPVSLRPDNRGQITADVKFKDSVDVETELQVTAHVNYEKGIINFHAVVSGGTIGSTFVVDFSEFGLRFTPYKTMNGRVRVQVEQSAIDITIDPNDDFLIELSEEDIQDFQSIYKMDLLRSLSEAIKRQILLNKDYDLAYFLKAAESDMLEHNSLVTVDMNQFTNSAGSYTPSTVVDVLKGIVPFISTMMGRIKRSYQMYPQFLVTGLNSASMLRSLQDSMVNLGGSKGEFGFSGQTAQFLKLQILESAAIDDNTIYLSTKAPQNALEKASIFDIVFKPLYVVEEVTDGVKRNFVRSRSAIEIARTDGLACIKLENLETYIG